MNRFLATALCALVLAVALVGTGSGRPAVACSCEETDVTSLDRADAAFAGTVESLDDVDDRYDDERAYLATIAVERDLKGNLDDTIHVRSYRDDGGNCGLNLSTGEQIEATIYVDEDGWFLTDGCSLVYGDVMDSWSPPAGPGGVPEVFITVYSAPYRFVAYGPTGDRLSFGYGDGQTLSMGLCDDDETLAEVVATDNFSEIRVELRSLATFEILETIPLTVDGEPFIANELACSTGPTVLAMWGRPTDRPADDRGVIYQDGVWTEADFAEQPQTRSRARQVDWPTVSLSAAEIQTQGEFDEIYELPVAVEVPASQAPVVTALGAGLGGDASSSGSSGSAAWWVIGLGAIVIVVLGAYVLSRERTAA